MEAKYEEEKSKCEESGDCEEFNELDELKHCMETCKYKIYIHNQKKSSAIPAKSNQTLFLSL